MIHCFFCFGEVYFRHIIPGSLILKMTPEAQITVCRVGQFLLLLFIWILCHLLENFATDRKVKRWLRIMAA